MQADARLHSGIDALQLRAGSVITRMVQAKLVLFRIPPNESSGWCCESFIDSLTTLIKYNANLWESVNMQLLKYIHKQTDGFIINWE